MKNTRLWQTGLIFIIVFMYLGSFRWLITSWLTNETYSQGLLIPIVSSILIWQKRDLLHDQNDRKSPVLFIASLVIYITGQLTGAIFITTVSLIPFILGIILFFKGIKTMHAVAFPVIFLIFAIPLPGLENVTLVLQGISTVLATQMAQFLGVTCSHEGCQILMGSTVFEIAPACSGLNSIISLYTIVALLCYLIPDPLIDKLVLFAAVLPLAIFANGFRITITLIIASYYGLDIGMNYFHDWGGISFYIIALASIFALLGCIRWMRKTNIKQ
jgi:exosortase